MSLAKKCSRCGKFYEHYPTGEKTQWNGVARIYMDHRGTFREHHCWLDFCPECMSAFDKFMMNGGRFDDKT